MDPPLSGHSNSDVSSASLNPLVESEVELPWRGLGLGGGAARRAGAGAFATFLRSAFASGESSDSDMAASDYEAALCTPPCTLGFFGSSSNRNWILNRARTWFLWASTLYRNRISELSATRYKKGSLGSGVVAGREGGERRAPGPSV